MPQNTLTEHIPGFEYRATPALHALAVVSYRDPVPDGGGDGVIGT